MSDMYLTYTPQEILDDYEVDVFAETVGELDGSPAVLEMLQALCWQRFRDRMIGDYDYEYWLIRLNDRVLTTWNWYKRLADMAMSPDLASLETAIYSETTGMTGSVVVDVDNTDPDIVESTDEDMPTTPIGPTDEYLSGRTRSNRNATAVGTSDETSSSNAEVSGTRTDGMKAELLDKLANALKSANVGFVRELDIMFVNRW